LNNIIPKELQLHNVIEHFSDENLVKLQKHFVSLYGSDELAKEKANSFAVGFGKACELIIKELKALNNPETLIYSVKRLSDNEIFSADEIVGVKNSPAEYRQKIKSFFIKDGNLFADIGQSYYGEIKNFVKLMQ